MKKIMAALVALWCSSFAYAGDLTRVELDVPDICNNWVNFPISSWTNNTGAPVYVSHIRGSFATAQYFVGEFAIWFYSAARGGWPTNGGMGGIIYSWGTENFAPPSGPIMNTRDLGADYFTIAPGDTLTAKVNCGPVNQTISGSPSAQGFSYTGVLEFYYRTTPN